MNFADGNRGEEGWTRVVGRRRRARKSSDSRSSDSEEELLIPENASVLFTCIGGKLEVGFPLLLEPGRNLSSCSPKSKDPLA